MLAVVAYRAASIAASVLPAPASDRLARTLAGLAFLARVPARRALERNLAVALPEAGARERARCARAGFDCFALGFARFLREREGPRPDATIVGRRHLELARSRGRGVILLSAHLGDWERGAALVAAQGLKVHLAARAHSPAIERLFAQRRREAGLCVLPRGALFSSAAAALRRGECVALMADRSSAPAGGASVCAWAAALARRTGAAVVPAVCVRGEAGEALVRFEPPLSPERCRDGAFRDTMRGWLRRWSGQWAAFEPLPAGLA
jgi:KDO2-lipid IV(A) lauroyltransferase